jgi:hypothetical protein
MEVAERILADGSVATALDVEALAPRIEAFLARGGYGAVAICLLNAYANPAHEQALAALIARLSPGLPVSLSSEIACRQACCDAPTCDGYVFATGNVDFINGGPAGCFLYVNITQLIPNSGYSSGIYESAL